MATEPRSPITVTIDDTHQIIDKENGCKIYKNGWGT